MDKAKNEERFKKELSICTRPGIGNLINFIDKSDMYDAPASTRFHMSAPGGLIRHSLNVLDALRSILTKNDDDTYSYYLCGQKVAIGGKNTVGEDINDIPEESLVLMALLHDICKTDFYEEEVRNRKNKETGKWENYTAYTINDKHPYGHGEKSVMMIESFIRLYSYEKYAIRWHMGFPEGTEKNTFGDAVEKYPIIWLVHTADLMASHFMESKDDNKCPF